MPRKKSDKAKSSARNTARTEPDVEMPYDITDEKSVLQYAARLTGKTLNDFVIKGEVVEGGVHTKGYFGQLVEREYFHLSNNNSPLPDFQDLGIELKVTPLTKTSKGIVPKERLILGIINYNDVPKRGFDIFLKKNTHILIIFYLWNDKINIYDYKILKVVNWMPSDEEMRLIREDWDVIEGYVMRGEAHLLSGRHTKILEACTKSAGHGKGMRSQPFSDVKASQRALSFKLSFMTTLYNTSMDVGSSTKMRSDEDLVPVIQGNWSESESFEECIVSRYRKYVGMTCREIEYSLGIELNEGALQYYHMLSLAMIGVLGKKQAKELVQADIEIKVVRISNKGTPDQSMSFPYIRFDKIVEQVWEESDFYKKLDHEFFTPVFSYVNKKMPKKDLVFKGAFFWSVSDDDFLKAKMVWEDTKAKVLAEDFDHFIKISDDGLFHIRPHGNNGEDMTTYRGKKVKKVSFWMNAAHVGEIVRNNLKCN